MFPAQKRETQPEMAPMHPRPPTANGFGKVLTSIQGLQQRLEDFSVEDAGRAEAKAKILIQQLVLLQSKLENLAESKQFVACANRTISELPEENFDDVAPDGLENHPQLHAIVQASKLIPLHRLLEAAKGGAGRFLDPEAGSLDIPVLAAQENVAAPDTATLPPSASLELSESAAYREAAPSEAVIAEHPVSSELTPVDDDEPRVLSDGIEPNAFHEAIADRSSDFELVGRQTIEASERTERSHTEKPAPSGKTQRNKSQTSAMSDSLFDQRLLSELIETYGEFAVTPNLSTAVEVPQAAEILFPEIEAPAAQQETPSPLELQSHEPEALSTREIEPAKPVEPQTLPTLLVSLKPTEAKSTEIVAIPAPKTHQPDPIKEVEKVPTLRKHGELDRQLKSIIKDYGEYDLYSHRSPTNFRTAAIAAFVLLGLVLGGFYFFKTPASHSPAAVSTAGQPGDADSAVNGDAGAQSVHAPKSQTK